RGTLWVRLGLEAVDHVVDCHRLAVTELHPLADLKGPYGGVGVGRPALGEPGMVLQLVVGEDQELTNLIDTLNAALVGDSDRVDGRGRRDHANIDGGPALAGGRRGGRGGRGGPPAGGKDGAEQRQ